MIRPRPAVVRQGRFTQRRVIAAAVALVVLIGLANAHLVYVAVSTQPECVKAATTAYRAAKPSC